MRNLKICGLQKTTLLDYPGHVAATVFIGGCNFRCPFCHNGELVTNINPVMTKSELLSFLKKRSGILEGVCITGGEPTLYPEELKELMIDIKNLGFLIKLDTNGTNPEFLSQCIGEKLVHYVAMDVKAPFSEYENACGISLGGQNEAVTERTMESIRRLKWFMLFGMVDGEFRTTLVKGIHHLDTMSELIPVLKDAKRYYLQQYVASNAVLAPDGLSAFTKEEMEQCADLFRPYITEVAIRGVD